MARRPPTLRGKSKQLGNREGLAETLAFSCVSGGDREPSLSLWVAGGWPPLGTPSLDRGRQAESRAGPGVWAFSLPPHGSFSPGLGCGVRGGGWGVGGLQPNSVFDLHPRHLLSMRCFCIRDRVYLPHSHPLRF